MLLFFNFFGKNRGALLYLHCSIANLYQNNFYEVRKHITLSQFIEIFNFGL
jgi:hypothetical protein